MVAYNKFQYLYPPRAENAIPTGLLGFYQNRGWLAQVKKNGTNSVIFVSPDRQLTAMGRHNNPHKAWSWVDGAKEIFRNIPGNGWYVFNAELMHSKGPKYKNTHYLHDMLVCNGEYLIGTRYIERYNMLKKLFLKDEAVPQTHSHWVLDGYTWLAKNHYIDFSSLFNSLTNDEDEGLVLKDPNGKLSIKDGACAGWSVKCRKGHKNFGF